MATASLKDIIEQVEDMALTAQSSQEKRFGTQYARSIMQLPALIISDINSSVSTAAARNVVNSISSTKSELYPSIIPATTPETLSRDLKIFGLSKNSYKYPLKGDHRIDIETGLHLTGYGANDVNKVISCFASHMRCWFIAATQRSPCVVLEHDALFIKKFDLFDKSNFNVEGKKLYDGLTITQLIEYGIVGLNSPKGATRRSDVYHNKVLQSSTDKSLPIYSGNHKIVEAPWVDNKMFPQGIAGNSAYVISPHMARQLLYKVNEIGIWPNDALMCKQFFPNQMHQIYPFVTELQGVKSTTQG